MAMARWYLAHPKGSGSSVYTRKCDGGKVAVIAFVGNKYNAVQHLTPEQARSRYVVGEVVDALTGTEVELNYRRLTQPAAKSPTPVAPPHNYADGTAPANGKPLTGQAGKVAGKSSERLHDRAVRNVNGTGVDALERGVNRLQEAVERCKVTKLVLVQYDVHGNNYSLDYSLWWSLASPLGESVWTFTEDSVQDPRMQAEIAEMVAHGSTIDVIPQGEESRAMLLSIAERNLAKRLTDLHTSLVTCLGNASERLDEARKELEEAEAQEPGTTTAADFNRLQRACDNKQRAIIREAGKDLQAALECARRFDVEENLKDLLEGLRKAIRSEAQSFNAQMRAKGSKMVSVQL